VLWYARKSESALYASERKVLRRTFGPMKINNSWGNIYNNLLYKLSEESSTSDINNLDRLQQAGHGLCIDEKHTPKKILESNIIGKKPLRKQRKYELMQWKETVERFRD
jgi:hypothetical protein